MLSSSRAARTLATKLATNALSTEAEVYQRLSLKRDVGIWRESVFDARLAIAFLRFNVEAAF